MSKKEIDTVLCELNKITGLRISLHDAQYREIAAYPELPLPFCARVNADPREHERCVDCDKSACRKALQDGDTVVYKCRYGLTESVSPLYNFGELSGFLMMGQVAQGERERDGAHRMLSDTLGEAPDKDAIPIVSSDMMLSYAKIMSICAKYLTLANATASARPPIVTRAKRYISEHIGEKILINDICRAIGCSKTTLLVTFKREAGMTVNEYLNEVRLTEAKQLLARADMTAAQVAAAVGFSDQAYFSKVFSARYGIPPSKYKASVESTRE